MASLSVIFRVVILCLVVGYGASSLYGEEKLSPVWSSSASGWITADSPPSGWLYNGPKALELKKSTRKEKEPVLVIKNVAGESGLLSIPYKGGGSYPKFTIEIKIGATSYNKRGLSWFLKKGTWEMRADRSSIFLQDPATKTRTEIGTFKPDRLQTIRLEYSHEEQAITSASVDGIKIEQFASYPAPALALGGSMSLYLPTDAESDIIFGEVTIYADANALIDLPRWNKPLMGETYSGQAPVLPKWTPITHADEIVFKIDPERLKNPRFEKGILFAKEDFASLQQFIDDDPAMQKFWSGLERQARQVLKEGRIDLPEDEAGRYTYKVRFIANLALLYAATGEPHLGEVLRTLVLDVANQPMWVWVHAELRKYDPEWPTGGLETAELARSLALAAIWAKDVFSEEEYEHVLEMLKLKGLDPSLRWLEERGMTQRNNWLAVIGGGALVAAIVLEDEEAQELCVTVLERWLSLIEDDGSYGEPQGYFEYGYSRFFFGWWSLGHERGKQMLQGKNLSKSLDWMVHYFIKAEHDGTTSAWRVNFGDDDFLTGPKGKTTFTRMVSQSLAYAYDDGLGTWIEENLIHPSSSTNLFEFSFLLGRAKDGLPAPVSPQEKDLPLAKSFDNGVTFIRSSWDFDTATLFAFRSGGANRTGYAHDRPNRNAYALFAHGDYLAIAPGRSSYRSPLFRGWDMETSSHNAITLDGERQIRERDAKIVEFEDGPEMVKVSSEAKGSYGSSPESVLRTVWYVKELDVFVVEDRVRMSRPQVPALHMLLSNFEDKSQITKEENGSWKLQREKANLSFWIVSDHEVTTSQEPGYMHVGYSYYPEGPFEGRKGSGISLTWKPNEKLEDIRYYSLLVPNKGSTIVDMELLSLEDGYPVWRVKGHTLTVQRSDVDGETQLIYKKPPMK